MFKKFNSFIAIITIIVFMVPAEFHTADATDISGNSLIKTNTFITLFSLYDLTLGGGHELSLEDMHITHFTNDALAKTVYHGCEVLSLTTNQELTEINSIIVSMATNVKNASQYSVDFAMLFMKTLLAAGIEYDTVSDILTTVGTSIENGNDIQMIVDGVHITGIITDYSTITFNIEKAE